MPLPEKNNQTITLAEATKYTSAFRRQSSPDAIKAGLFWKEHVQTLLDQASCVAMRYYHALNEIGSPVIVLIGVDSDGNDITNGTILEIGLPCPPFCSSNNQLNS